MDDTELCRRRIDARSRRAYIILARYAADTGDSGGMEEDAGMPVRDMLADFMHYCDRYDLLFQQECERALQHYQEECSAADEEPGQYTY